MGLCSGDDIGKQMEVYYADKAGIDAQKENLRLREEVERLKARLDKMEATPPDGP